MVWDNLTDDTVCPSDLPVIQVTGYSEGLLSNRLRKSLTVAIHTDDHKRFKPCRNTAGTAQADICQ